MAYFALPIVFFAVFFGAAFLAAIFFVAVFFLGAISYLGDVVRSAEAPPGITNRTLAMRDHLRN
jgi:hypothetical protein